MGVHQREKKSLLKELNIHRNDINLSTKANEARTIGKPETQYLASHLTMRMRTVVKAEQVATAVVQVPS